MSVSHELIVPETGFPFKLFLFEGSRGNYYREKHWHRSVEIFAVCRGRIGFYIGEKLCPLTGGGVMIVDSNEGHPLDCSRANENHSVQESL